MTAASTLQRVTLILSWAFLTIGPLPRLHGFTAPTDWSLDVLQDESSAWWQVIRVGTVPGVRYHLEHSPDLEPGTWSDITSHYGNDGEWICALFPGSPPAQPPPAGQTPPVLPSQSASQIQIVHVVLERTASNQPVLSWQSLDNGDPLRVVLSGATLGSVWEELERSRLNFHGDFLFVISPRLHEIVTPATQAPTLGQSDSDMVATLATALPQIEQNIGDSDLTSSFAPQQQNGGNRGFYRIRADWAVDSDGDGHFNWRELILYGTNPYAADSNGDGQPDQATTNNAPLPEPEIPASPELLFPPLAFIQQQEIRAYGTLFVYPNDPGNPLTGSAWAYGATPEELETLGSVTSFAAFMEAVSGLSFGNRLWLPPTSTSSYQLKGAESDMPGSPADGSYTINWFVSRSRFRLKLHQPAPEGGYSIPVKIGVIYQDGPGLPIISPPAGKPAYHELMLKIEEGATEGSPVELPIEFLTSERFTISYVLAFPTLWTNHSNDPQQWSGGSPSVSGNCMIAGESFNLTSEISGFYHEDPTFRWQVRQLRGDATFGQWTSIPGSDHPAYQGGGELLRLDAAGIYQVRGALLLPTGDEIHYPMVRMRNSRSMKDSRNRSNPLLRAGQPDYIGICANPLSKQVWDRAALWLGSDKYAAEKQVTIHPGALYNPNTKESPKCNIFVTHVANQVGATTPFYYRRFFIPTAPIAKDDWYNEPELNIDLDGPGWNYQGLTMNPSPGMVITSPRTSAGERHGHVGFLDYDGSWINAGAKTINKSLHILDQEPDYKPNTMCARP